MSKTSFDQNCFDCSVCVLCFCQRLLALVCLLPFLYLCMHPCVSDLFCLLTNLCGVSHPTVTIQRTRRLRSKRNQVVSTFYCPQHLSLMFLSRLWQCYRLILGEFLGPLMEKNFCALALCCPRHSWIPADCVSLCCCRGFNHPHIQPH